MRIEGKKVFVDVERGRTVENWRPRRVGGGAVNRRLLPAKKGPKNTERKRARSPDRYERDNRRRY